MKKIPEPTHYLPGSNEKILVFMQRLSVGEELYHVKDAKLNEDIENRLYTIIKLLKKTSDESYDKLRKTALSMVSDEFKLEWQQNLTY